MKNLHYNLFQEAANYRRMDECVMIGDDYVLDCIGAINAGMDTILVDKYNQNPK